MARILVVDDEPSIRDLVALVLELDKHDVVTASDGNAALAELNESEFDLVITDLVMPDREGIEIIINLRKTRPELQVIAMSGGGFGNAGDYLELAAAVGAARTLAKPFTNDQLLKAVRDVLGG
jgi:DNA-binding NtrC family response regulator